MIASEIITQFELQVSDVTELSTSEELKILNHVYRRICRKRPWEFLKVFASGTILTDATGSYMVLPSNFSWFIPKTFDIEQNSPFATFSIGSNYAPFQLVDYENRLSYAGRSGYAYIDRVNSKIYFTGSTPPSGTYLFPYIKSVTDLTGADTPLIPTDFQDILIYGMATENSVLQLSPKATSYAPENKGLYDETLADLELWDAQFKL